MKTTLIIDDDLLSETMKIYKVSTKTQAIELALKDTINNAKRKKIVKLFGKRKEISPVPRRFNACNF